MTRCYRWRGVRKSPISIRVDALVLVFLFLLVPAHFVVESARAQDQQGPKVHRIGYLRVGPPPSTWVEALQQGLRERGYIDGQNVVLDVRFTDGTSVDQLRPLADELVRSKVDVILAAGASPGFAARRATTSVPIVFVPVFDPVELGLVASLGHPGGNITGLAFSNADLSGKRLDVLRELIPKLRRVAVVWDRANPASPAQLRGVEAAARTLGIQLQPAPVQDPSDFDAAFRAVRGVDGLLQLDSPLFTTHRARLAGFAATSRLPAIYGYREIVDAGGLMSYGPDFPDMYRRAATYVDKILRGAKPADLPVEQPTRFELVINLKTARLLGLTIPQSLLLRVDHVIE